MRRVWLLLGVMVFSLLASSRAAYAQGSITNLTAIGVFGEKLTFSASLETPGQIRTAYLFFQESGTAQTVAQPATLIPEQAPGQYQMEVVIPIDSTQLRAFSTIDYRFEVSLEDGTVITSEAASFEYIDNRHDWQLLSEGPFRVHWYEGSVPLAQSALDAAQVGFQRIQGMLPLPAAGLVDIYIYPQAQDMQDALSLSNREWVAGHADPDLGVIVVSLPAGPEQMILTEQRVPHELMHVLLYQSTGQSYENLPVWLVEGLASNAELVDNPDYTILIEDAYKMEKLIPFSLLCRVFPSDASGAMISYAQSASFSKYLYETYGTPGLQALLERYSSGQDCETGARVALGEDLSQLEQQWRISQFNEDLPGKAFHNLLPWLLLMAGVLLIPLLLGLVIAYRKSTRRSDRDDDSGQQAEAPRD